MNRIYTYFLFFSLFHTGFAIHFVNTHTFIKYDEKYQIIIEERMQENEKDEKRSIYSLHSVIMTILSFSSFQRVLVWNLLMEKR